MFDRNRVRVWALAATLLTVAISGKASEGQAAADDGLTSQLLATVQAWNTGDLDGFVAPYAEASTYMTPAGPIGKAAMLARYRTRYFTGSRPDQQLRFEELVVRPLGTGHSLMTGRYVLAGGGKPELTGRFTLVWAKLPEGWRIVHDHSS